MSNVPTPVEIFCCYAHEDEAWLRKLEIHLSLLKRQGLISLWYDRLIAPGSDWVRAIDAHLETVSVILLLVSADFLASDYCYSVEMKRAMARQEAGEARVIPILVRPVDWNGAPFAHLQALPTDARPLEMWENQEMALANIASGIRRAIEDVPMLSSSAPRAVLPVIWNIPYPRNPFFLGRDAELAQVHSYLQAGWGTALSQPQAISGLGGIGKTQLALEYAYRYHQDYQAILWAGAESTEALVSSYISIATLLRLPEREVREQNITVQAVKIWLQTHRGWLLILDNADELTLLPDFLPPSLGGHLLLTTRAAATGRLAHRLEIETLLPEQGALFLLRRSALLAPDATLDQASQEERKLAWQISEELGGLPLALDQAGAYLEETGTSLSSYWQIYQLHRADLLQQRGGLVADHPAPVATTWSLSFLKVEEKNPAAADLLCLCAYLAPDAIPEDIISVGASDLGPVLRSVAADAFRLNATIEVLRQYSLLRRNPETKMLSIHRLVRAVLIDRMTQKAQRQWVQRAVCAVNRAFPENVDEVATWPQCQRYLPQAQACAVLIAHYSITVPEASHLLNRAGHYLHFHAQYEQAKLLYQYALTIRERMLGETHPDTAVTLHHLAWLYRDQDEYEQAELLYLRALSIREQALGEHPSTASTLNHLASLYQDQRQYERAEPLYLRSLAIKEKELGREHTSTANTLHNLATLYQDQDQYERAEPLYLRALSIREQSGPQHPYAAGTLHRLATLYEAQGKCEQAEPLYLRALSIYEQQLGSQHPDTASTLNNLAGLYRLQGKDEEAELLLRRV